VLLRQHAALVSSKLTRGTSGVNLPPSEVIMSRQPKTACMAAHRAVSRRGPMVGWRRRGDGGRDL